MTKNLEIEQSRQINQSRKISNLENLWSRLTNVES